MKTTKQNSTVEHFLRVDSNTELARIFFPLFLVLVFALLVVFTFIIKSDHDKYLAVRLKEETKNLDLMRFSMLRDLEILASDLKIVAGSEYVSAFINNPSPETLKEVGYRFSTFLTDRKIYDQLRIINARGFEETRVDRKGEEAVIMSPTELQDKKDRYYFKETMMLHQGQIYLSPLDLNIEHDKIERPIKPMLRIATPLYNNQNHCTGMVILNYKAERMLEWYSLAQQSDSSSRFFLLNKDGYWLKAHDPNIEWGFMLAHKNNFSTLHPEIWKKIQTSGDKGVLENDGVFLFQKIIPRDEILSTSKGMPSGNNQLRGPAPHNDAWYLMCQVPGRELSYSATLHRHQDKISWLMLAIAVLTFTAWQVALTRIEKQKNLRSMKLLSQGLEQSPTAVVITDTKCNILYVNPTFEKMSGYSSEEVIGQHTRMFKSGRTENKTYEDLWLTLAENKTWHGYFENRRKNQKTYQVEAHISPITGINNQSERFIAVLEDVTVKIQLQQKLKRYATIDTLTGAYNRGYFTRNGEKELQRIARYDRPASLLLFDLDHFKNVNDTYGHAAGDTVLKCFSRCAAEQLRDSDILGRIGGEEFGVLLVETDLAGARQLAERIREAISELVIPSDKSTISITVSVGCTSFDGPEDSLSDMLKRADKELYRAKKNGRNRVECTA
jgi:diguanylate cyclase (GGDEF)-like protein/PAS domain S-box-containing protein